MRLILLFCLVLPLLAQGERRNPLPIPDIAGYSTLKCDFHMHTVFSDGVVWPETRVAEAWRDGLDCLAITDHDDYHPHKETVSTDLSKPHAIAAPLARRLGLVLVPGIEITKGDLHVNALFVTDFNATAGKPLLESLREAKRQNAFTFWNHPGWKGRLDWYPEIDEAHRQGLLDGVEVVNFGKLEPQTLGWIGPKNLTILSNTDIHELVEIPAGQHRESITLVFARSRDLDGIREALKQRRTLAWLRDELWGQPNLLRPLADSLLSARRADKLVIFRNRGSIPLSLQVGQETVFVHANAETRIELPQGPKKVEVLNFHLTAGGNLSFTAEW
ncbi:MAG: PHP domain-containing protein [Bryobacter sp.]|jgi:hypothetical protein|nr:PHP domain-containing protein [Bryobacter sp. CoA8 C33]